MAKYDVTYGCGHEATIQLYGPGKDRDRKIEWLERDGLCGDCYKAKRDAEFAARNTAAAAENAALVALTGSDKQIAWAESIRRDQLAGLAKRDLRIRPAMMETIGVTSNDPRIVQMDNMIEQMVSTARTQASAKWWIDNRAKDLSAGILAKLKTALETLFVLELEQARAAKIEAVEETKRQRDQERAVTHKMQETADDRSEAAAAQLQIVRVEREGEDLVIYAEHNHIAKGYVMDGDWVVYQIDELAVNSLLPNATALSARVRECAVGVIHA